MGEISVLMVGFESQGIELPWRRSALSECSCNLCERFMCNISFQYISQMVSIPKYQTCRTIHGLNKYYFYLAAPCPQVYLAVCDQGCDDVHFRQDARPVQTRSDDPTECAQTQDIHSPPYE